jgi:chemotaxis protein methyltransferase CheR
MTEPTPQVLAILRMLIEERTGLRYTADDTRLLSDKLALRAAEAGFESLLDYYYYLRYDPGSGQEFDELVDALVVNETYFFREYPAVAVVVDEVVVPVLEREPRARVWSAACSTGEEPFTVAMLLADRGVLDRVEIVATDISDRALALARSATFRPRSVRSDELPREGARWLEIAGGRPVLSSRIRDAVRFQKLNLMEESAVAELGSFDAILCRNVLIYFSDETIQRLLTSFTKRLRPNGVLLVGTCESLLRFTTSLVCEERKGTFVYRKVS